GARAEFARDRVVGVPLRVAFGARAGAGEGPLPLHQPNDAFAADALAGFDEVDIHARAAVGLAAPLVRFANEHRQPPVPGGACRFRPRAPGVEARARDTEQRAGGGDGEVGPLRFADERELHVVSLAKKAARFFSRSRSILSWRFSLRSAASSSLSAVVSPVFPL